MFFKIPLGKNPTLILLLCHLNIKRVSFFGRKASNSCNKSYPGGYVRISLENSNKRNRKKLLGAIVVDHED